MYKIDGFQKIETSPNLWKKNNKYYRLTAWGETPNNCWLISPKMIELKDIDIATGKDVYGEKITINGGVVGTVPANLAYTRVR